MAKRDLGDIDEGTSATSLKARSMKGLYCHPFPTGASSGRTEGGV